MNNYKHACCKAFALALSVLLLAACGGGGSSSGGGSGAASIDASNAQEIGETAGESVNTATATDSLPGGISIDSNQTVVSEKAKAVLQASIDALTTGDLASIPAAVTTTTDVSSDVCAGGGTSIVTSTGDGVSGSFSGEIVYTNCVFSDGFDSYTINGLAIFEFADISSQTSAYSFEYRNFTISGSFGTQTLNYTFSCTNLSDENSCTEINNFVGSDGFTHTLTDVTYTGNASSGYTGSATLNHGVYGEVTIQFTSVTFGGSCGGSPNGGEISFSSTNGSSGTIMFNSDCSVSGTWNDGTTSGSF